MIIRFSYLVKQLYWFWLLKQNRVYKVHRPLGLRVYAYQIREPVFLSVEHSHCISIRGARVSPCSWPAFDIVPLHLAWPSGSSHLVEERVPGQVKRHTTCGQCNNCYLLRGHVCLNPLRRWKGERRKSRWKRGNLMVLGHAPLLAVT